MIKHKLVYSLPLLLLVNGALAADTNSNLELRVNQLERAVDGKGLLNILNEQETLQQEVRELRGEIEQQAYTIEQMKKRQQSLYDDLDQRLQGSHSQQNGQSTPTGDLHEAEDRQRVNSLEENAIPNGAESSEFVENTPGASSIETPSVENSSSIKPVETYVSKSQADETVSPTVNTNTDAEDQAESSYPQSTSDETVTASDEETSYSEAFNLLKQGQHDKAIDQFRVFLKQYPSSKYADNAQYWLGESFYVKREFKFAIMEYKSLLGNYADSGKASHAQLKIAYCYDELGQKELAQSELEDLIARYPGTSAASLAEDRLNQIRSQ